MNQTTIGQSESSIPRQTAEDRLVEVDRVLDEYERSAGLPERFPEAVQSESTRLLSLEPGQLSRMSAAECSEAAFTLYQFAYHLQRQVNRELARVRWAEESVKHIIAPRMTQQKGYSFEERRLLAVRENDAALKIEQIRVKAQLRVDRLSYLSSRVENMAHTLDRAQYSRSTK